MKAILLLGAVHLLIIYQSQKQLPPKADDRNMFRPVLTNQKTDLKDLLMSRFFNYKESFLYSLFESYGQKW
jgi:hypothetical protein